MEILSQISIIWECVKFMWAALFFIFCHVHISWVYMYWYVSGIRNLCMCTSGLTTRCLPGQAYYDILVSTDTMPFLHLYCRVHSILQVLLFAGLNELVVVSNVLMDVAVQCGWIYILVWRCFPEHQSYVYLNEWGKENSRGGSYGERKQGSHEQMCMSLSPPHSGPLSAFKIGIMFSPYF